MSFRFDHAVILVADLDAATADYTTLGFTVVQGGQHANGLTHNALIAFPDGSYFELLAFIDGIEALKTIEPDESSFLSRVRERGAAGEGLVDFALGVEDAGAVIRAAEKRGLVIAGPIEGGRARPDGVQMAWRNGIPRSPLLPFVISDVTPRSRRVPEGPARIHANGVRGVRSITVAADNLPRAIAEYSALLGRSPLRDLGLPGVADFVLVGKAYIRLLAAREGRNGPIALSLSTADTRYAGRLDLAKSHGAPLELVYDGR
jgi:catechol 2,3-dioxygenase-like lactoylglutathione lyase family enzyme